MAKGPLLLFPLFLLLFKARLEITLKLARGPKYSYSFVFKI